MISLLLPRRPAVLHIQTPNTQYSNLLANTICYSHHPHRSLSVMILSSRFISAFYILAASLDVSNAKSLRSRKLPLRKAQYSSNIPNKCREDHYLYDKTPSDKAAHRLSHDDDCKEFWHYMPSALPTISASPTKMPTRHPSARK